MGKVVRSGDSGATTTVRLTDKPFRPTPQKLTPIIGSKTKSDATKTNISTKAHVAKPKKQNKTKNNRKPSFLT